MKFNEKRIRALEDKAGLGASEKTTIFLMWFGGEITGALAGGSMWAREPGETHDSFQARLTRDALISQGNTFRIIKFIGVLSDGPLAVAK